MSMHSIAVTGATSFTGAWIAHHLGSSERWRVSALSPQLESAYDGIKAARVALVREMPRVRLYFGVRAEDGGMAAWIREHRPEVWVHHHHFMERFRAPDYDFASALRVGIEPLAEIIAALRDSGCRAIVYSSSYFEPRNLPPGTEATPTPYALSKERVWDELECLAEEAKIPLGKIVIPNPVGWLENEDRFLPQFLKRAREGSVFLLASPESKGDQLPVRDLARGYEHAALALLEGTTHRVWRPSGWKGTLREWADFANREWIVKRLGLAPVRIEYGNAAATAYSNADRIRISWDEFWDELSVQVNGTKP